MTVENKNKGTQVGLLVSYYIVLSFWAAQTLAMSMISRNIAGQTKKTVVVAMSFVAWATRNAIGPQGFLSWNVPRYFIAFAVHELLHAVGLGNYVFEMETQKEKREEGSFSGAGIKEAKDEMLVHRLTI